MIFAILGLGGCASTTPALDIGSPDLGDAVAHNIAAQRISPSPEEKANTFIPPNRARQKAAREAYENGTVAAPETITTTEN